MIFDPIISYSDRTNRNSIFHSIYSRVSDQFNICLLVTDYKKKQKEKEEKKKTNASECLRVHSVSIIWMSERVSSGNKLHIATTEKKKKHKPTR